MKKHMSVNVDEAVAENAKRRAVDEGTSVSSIVERALLADAQRTSAAAMAKWERENGLDTPEMAYRDHLEYEAVMAAVAADGEAF